jgi:radical SAM superfamily enzyme YgiQ (UPF0313 family)
LKITFIKPNIGRREHSLYIDHGRMEPLMLAVLAGMTPPDVDVVLHDDRMEAIPYDEPTDLVAISVESYTARRSYEIAAEYRERGVQVILGGMHPTLIPDEAARHADSIFLGDAELIWRDVVEDARYRKLKKVYSGPPGIEAQDRRLLFFVDDNIASDRKALKELCHALIPMRVSWISQMSLDITHDEELMRLIADSGNLGNVTGFESITLESLKETKKSPNISAFSNYEHELKVLRDHGMQTWAAFTLGYDHDTYDSVMATLEFALENRFTFSAFNILMPYPGTPLYDRLKAEGRLLYDDCWWLHPEYRFNDAAYVPTRMTPDELTEACHTARKRYNSIPGLLHRFADIKTNMRTLQRMLLYWRYTTIFRSEVYRKHGMRFGLK